LFLTYSSKFAIQKNGILRLLEQRSKVSLYLMMRWRGWTTIEKYVPMREHSVGIHTNHRRLLIHLIRKMALLAAFKGTYA